ncbi:MAG: hypothetical protein O3A01_04840 [bacterium]|nr:hypothetical protein [bacterium]
MINETEDYKVIVDEDGSEAFISGIMRLQSPSAYEKPFEGIINTLDKCENLLINIEELAFLNSSGISSLARIVLKARQLNVSLIIKCKQEIPWQEKTLTSLAKLYPSLEIQTS